MATSRKKGNTAETPEPIKQITLERLPRDILTVEIEGLTPIIPHKWSEKSLRLMRDKQFGQGVKPKREPKNPEEEADAATYWVSDGIPGMPATAFKAAMVSACRFFEGLTMTAAKQMFFVVGEGADQLVPLKSRNPILREDTPRNATGVVDLRYRYAWFPWAARIQVQYRPTLISPDSIVAIVDAAGSVGVGDWRPGAPKSATGTFGQFTVKG